MRITVEKELTVSLELTCQIEMDVHPESQPHVLNVSGYESHHNLACRVMQLMKEEAEAQEWDATELLLDEANHDACQDADV